MAPPESITLGDDYGATYKDYQDKTKEYIRKVETYSFTEPDKKNSNGIRSVLAPVLHHLEVLGRSCHLAIKQCCAVVPNFLPSGPVALHEHMHICCVL